MGTAIPQPPAARRRIPPELRHTYDPGLMSREGKDGRLYRVCRVCLLPANAGRHRTPERAAQLAAHRAAVDHVHPFEPSGQVVTDKGGRRRVLCATCGKARNVTRHRVQTDRAPGASPHQGPGPAQVAPAPTRAPSTRRARSIAAPAPAEYVMVALAIDRVLALPADVVGWRLRMRLADARALLEVPDHPTLYAPETEPDPEAPPPTLVESRPILAPKVPEVASVAQARGLLRGIRSDRIKRLAMRAVAQGWELTLTGSGHLRLAKGDQVVIASATAETGSGHGWGNTRAAAKRAGIDVTGL